MSRWIAVFAAVTMAAIAVPLIFALPQRAPLKLRSQRAGELRYSSKAETKNNQQHTASPAPHAAQINGNLQQNTSERSQNAPPDWWLDWFTAGLVIVGLGQLLVFGYQAHQLRRSIDLTRGISDRQEHDMRASINEAGRAATAMEGVAAGIAESVENTRQFMTTQREFAQRQMRAYLSVSLAGCVPQDRTTGWRMEIRMLVANNGLTPAHAVVVVQRLKVMPFPLPNDIDLSLPVARQEDAGHIPPRAQFFFRAWLDELLDDTELEAVKREYTMKVYVYGTIYYRDIFGYDHYTNFCQFVLWDIKENVSTINVPRHNDAT